MAIQNMNKKDSTAPSTKEQDSIPLDPCSKTNMAAAHSETNKRPHEDFPSRNQREPPSSMNYTAPVSCAPEAEHAIQRAKLDKVDTATEDTQAKPKSTVLKSYPSLATMPTTPEDSQVERNTKDSMGFPPTIEEVSALPMPVVPTTFHPFNRLAIELRFMIWTEAIREWDKRIVIWGKPVVPPLLHASPESRMLFLNNHRVECWETGGDHPRREVLFVDWEKNAVYFPTPMPGLNGVPIRRIIEPANVGDEATQQLPSEPQTEQKGFHELRYLMASKDILYPLIFNTQPVNVGKSLLKEFPKLKKLILDPMFNRPLEIDDEMDDICYKGFKSYLCSRVELGAFAFRNPEYRHGTLFVELNVTINWCEDPGESAEQEYLGAGEGLY